MCPTQHRFQILEIILVFKKYLEFKFFRFGPFETCVLQMIPLQAALAEKVGAESPGRNNISPIPEELMPTTNVVFECILPSLIEQTNTKYNKSIAGSIEYRLQ
jgi:hypothetical protein